MSLSVSERLRDRLTNQQMHPDAPGMPIAPPKLERIARLDQTNHVVPPPRMEEPLTDSLGDAARAGLPGEIDTTNRWHWRMNATLAVAVLTCFAFLWVRDASHQANDDRAMMIAQQTTAHGVVPSRSSHGQVSQLPISRNEPHAAEELLIAKQSQDSMEIEHLKPNLLRAVEPSDPSERPSSKATDLRAREDAGPLSEPDDRHQPVPLPESTASVVLVSLESNEPVSSLDAESPQLVEASGQNEPDRPSVEASIEEMDAIVASALEAELNGNQDDRERYLASVLLEDPGHSAANWQSGRIEMGGEWLELDEAQERGKENPVLAAYRRMRSSNEGTAEGELVLARWCKTRRPQASRMYYTRLIDRPETSPMVRAEAAKYLGLVAFRGQYVPQSELARLEAQAERYKTAHRRWDAAIARWQKWLRPQSSPEQRTRAELEMREVDDPDFALVARLYAANGNERLELKLLSIVERFPDAESSRCLAQYAATTRFPTVRKYGVDALRERKLHDYVPELMGSLIGRMESDGQVDRALDGTIRFRHTFRQENAREDVEKQTSRDARPIVSFAPRFFDHRGRDLGTRFTGLRTGTRLADQEERSDEDRRVQSEFQAELLRRERATKVFNANAELSNQRICSLLADTTDQELGNEPKLWWDWWKSYNGIDFQKSQRQYLDDQEFTYVAINAGPRYQRRHSCFAAGTPVATESGMRPVEQVLPGDRVFAKDALTGELKLQTVLVATIRPARQLLDLTINGEVIRTTPGHPFWVSGEGWRMAKLLQEGDRLHGMYGIVELEKVEPVPAPEPVHNLIVDEFSNYFVGNTLALVHDNTFRRPVPVSLPGLLTKPKSVTHALP